MGKLNGIWYWTFSTRHYDKVMYHYEGELCTHNRMFVVYGIKKDDYIYGITVKCNYPKLPLSEDIKPYSKKFLIKGPYATYEEAASPWNYTIHDKCGLKVCCDMTKQEIQTKCPCNQQIG